MPVEQCSAAAGAGRLLELMADSTGAEMIHLQFDHCSELTAVQLLIAMQWSRVLATAIDAEQQSAGQGSAGKTVIPMGCSRDDWLLAMSFCCPASPPAEVAWENLEVSICSRYG